MALENGPESEGYWDVWNSVLNKAFLIDYEGNRFTLYQDGDLWALCFDRMTPEEKSNFGFESDDDATSEENWS